MLCLTLVFYNLFPQSGDTPLHDAAIEGHLDIVTLLTQRGAELSRPDDVSVIGVLLLVVVWSQLN